MHDSAFVAVCCGCGHAISKYEIGGEIRGTYSDYLEHVPGEITIVLCIECWEKTKQIVSGGLQQGIRVRNTLSRQDEDDALPA
jgi:hypothetical protein